MARSRKSVDDVVGAALAASGPGPIALAYSGGLDSTVLLHAAVRAVGPARVLALHVHHGLQADAERWSEHCAERAGALGVACVTLRARGRPAAGDSVEQWARRERYRLLLDAARDARAAALLTAHHADDQLETLLLALARGCGLDGLTGIAAHDRREGVVLLRPLLALDRATLAVDARARGLDWIDDPSNADTALARNAIRHRLLPVLRDVLPTLAANLPDALASLADARRTVDAQSRDDLRSARLDDDPRALDRRGLAALPPARRTAALRAWVAALGAAPPSRAKSAELCAQLVDGAQAGAELRHDGWLLLRHRDRLTALDGARPAAIVPCALRWSGEAQLVIAGAGRLTFTRSDDGLDPGWLARATLEVIAGPSSARLKPDPRRPSRTLKNLRQEAGMPRWLRDAFPSIRIDGRLAMAAPFGMDRGEDWPTATPGIEIGWTPDETDTVRAAFVARR